MFGWIAVVTVLLSQINYFKEFNGFENKIARYNVTIKSLTDLSHWWMSLNLTEKNSRDCAEKLVLDSEITIIEEFKTWMSSSQANKIMKESMETKNEDNEKESKNEIKEDKK